MTQFAEIFQPEIWFFRPDGEPPCEEQRVWWCDSENPGNPFSTFVGNEAAVRRLSRAAFQAFGRHDHQCGDFAFAFVGPPSTGKATLARMFAELICLPFVEIDAPSCNDLNDIAVAIAKVLEDTTIPGNDQYSSLELQDLGDGEIMIPPCIVLLNEIDHLPKKVERGLRQAVAGNFATNGWTFDSKLVCWTVATTELLLPHGFDRFTTIRLKPLSVEEVAQVMALNFPDLPAEVSLLIAQHAPSPRDALAFAEEMRIEWEMHGGDDWREVAAAVAKDWGVAPWVNRVSRNGRH